jgi:hypothetical protein
LGLLCPSPGMKELRKPMKKLVRDYWTNDFLLWSNSGNQCTAVFARWSRTFPLSGKWLLLFNILEGGTWRKVTRSIDGWVYGIGARVNNDRHITELICILLASFTGCSVLVCRVKYRHLNCIYPPCTANPSSVYWKGWRLDLKLKLKVARRGLYSTAALYIADCAVAPNDVVPSFIFRGATTPSGAGALY